MYEFPIQHMNYSFLFLGTEIVEETFRELRFPPDPRSIEVNRFMSPEEFIRRCRF